MKACLYARFSTDKQKDASIDDQFRECERVAKSAGLTVVARFEDKGISGGTHNRPAYQGMLTAAREHRFDVIICEDISRLWRSRAEFGPRSAELEDLGVHCITCVGDDTRRDGWGLVIQIKQAVAEHARREASYRTRRGLEGRAIAGQTTGGRAYGYIPARDGTTGQLEINETEAATVRRIFESYADGIGPRGIAAMLNAEGVPSPGAHWKRAERRRDCKWLASAIHGDVLRGTGILNNKRYTGIVLWGRSEWKRMAADSQKRRHRMLAKGSGHEGIDEHLRIVPQALWERVKARQAQRSSGIGALVRGGLRKRAAGAGRPGKYLFSGLLACAVCQASFVLRNRTCYACASWWNGAACSNSINVPRSLVQDVMLKGIREDLADPAMIEEFQRRVQAAVNKAMQPKADHGQRVKELEREINNLADAIGSGQLRTSPILAQRLQSAEAELARVQTAHPAKRPSLLVPNIRKRFLEMVGSMDQVLLEKDPDRGREELRGILGGERIKMLPDESGRFLWADYSLGLTALLPPGSINAEIMVAGARSANFRRALRR